MISPNLVFKLVSIFFLIFGFFNLIYQSGINKIVGIFMIFYAYVNILSLRNKGKRQFKLALLKINICVLAFTFLIILLKLLKENNKNKKNDISKEDILTLTCVILLFLIIAHYICLKNYKLN